MVNFGKIQEAPIKEEHLNPLQRQNMRIFIEATKELLKNYGAEGLSIRKIAAKAGYNSATIYNYFQDAEELILYGSVTLFRDIFQRFFATKKKNMTNREKHILYFRCLNETSFRNAKIFYNMFYGTHRNELGHILRVYFQQLYPQELDGLDEEMSQAMREGTLLQNSRVIFASCFAQEGYSEEITTTTAVILNALYHTYLHEAVIKGDAFNVEAYVDKFEQMLNFILDAAEILAKNGK